MRIAIVYSPIRRVGSTYIQYQLITEGLQENGVKVDTYDTFTDDLTQYDVLIWWMPFRTPEFENFIHAKKRYTKLQLLFNPIDTNSLSEFVKKRLKYNIDLIITPSTHNYELFMKEGFNPLLLPHAIHENIDEVQCELNDDRYYIETRSFPYRRGTDIALQYDVKVITAVQYVENHNAFLKVMCKAGNMIIPARGGAFEIQALEALALGMKVYYSQRKIFDYIIDFKPTFEIRGEYCKTEYLNDIYQVGCYDNVIKAKTLPELPKPNRKHYLALYNQFMIARRLMEEIMKHET
ncbi:putative glycosyltransferase [Sulfolobus filamentous virus 1]|uniref:Putative glycosyltransferase n=2 Tax=Alphalipothrixvirus beppuense TaxID=2734584 RepID=A0A346LU55_SUFV1|nr:putative glycosyltransferase [Sulfolobus filamentous virus 1]AXQ00098.1 putative glycosyltransferase [Sulfolobus filamentous virus 1]AZI75718.1 putative glycosyltransferase [Sulfolobales Beppu filamentous phage 1]